MRRELCLVVAHSDHILGDSSERRKEGLFRMTAKATELRDEAINNDIYQYSRINYPINHKMIPPGCAAKLVSHFLRIFFEAAIWNSLNRV